MSDLPATIEDAGEVEELFSARPSTLLRRDAELVGSSRAKIRTPLDKLIDDILRGFEDQKERSDDQQRFWEAYHCVINECQYYHGIAEIYFPIIHDAVNARATRFVNQMFPQGGRSVEVVAADGSRHASLVGLLEHYLREAQFETQVMKPLCRNGDIEGQYNLYMGWLELTRHLVSRETQAPIDPATGAEMPGPEMMDIIEEEVVIGRPAFEVLHDCDVLVLPQTADSIEEALEAGGSVTIVRRWSKAKIDQMIASGEIKKDEGKALKDEMSKISEGEINPQKKLLEHIGIDGKGKEATVWETWTKLPLKDGAYNENGDRLLCRVYFGPGRKILGAKRNPYWNDLCPLLSAPVEKVAGVFKGISLIQHVASLQYEANDAVNEGADAATLSAGPIIRRDTEKTNTVPVLAIGAVWDAPKDAFELMAFPDLTPRAVTRVQMALQAIFQSLGVNPSMLPQQTRAGKPNQAQIAQEQQVDLLTTAEGVKVLSQMIATPALGMMVDFDYQFRDKDILVRAFGNMGREAVIEEVAPLQNRAGFTFTWRGAEQVKLMMAMKQEGIAFVNVVRPMSPQLAAEGIELRTAPLIEAMATNIFGPILGSQVIVDKRQQLTIDAEMEVEMMLDGHETHPHPLDNDQQKIPIFFKALQERGDPHGLIRVRLQEQQRQMQMKAQAQMQKAMQQQMSGNGPPQGGPAGPMMRPGGAPGMPQPGVAPAGPRQIKGPPGMVHPDRGPAAGMIAMPRRA